MNLNSIQILFAHANLAMCHMYNTICEIVRNEGTWKLTDEISLVWGEDGLMAVNTTTNNEVEIYYPEDLYPILVELNDLGKLESVKTPLL
jgi:hypothetical protein